MQKEDAWKFVWEVIEGIRAELNLDEIPIEKIFVNFGRWQSQCAGSERPPATGHAHINIVLTEEAIEACEK